MRKCGCCACVHMSQAGDTSLPDSTALNAVVCLGLMQVDYSVSVHTIMAHIYVANFNRSYPDNLW